MARGSSVLHSRWFYYPVGLVAGSAISAGLSAWARHTWNFLAIPGALVLTWWAQRKGWILSREEEERPIELFPSDSEDSSGNAPRPNRLE